MWNHHTDDDGKKVLSWKDFPAANAHRDEAMTTQIAQYMRRILDRYEDSEFIKYLVLPSPVALSGFFHCAVDEIHAALKELQRQGYEFEAAGNAGPITLWDPLIRRRSSRRQENTPWQTFYQALFNPASQVAS